MSRTTVEKHDIASALGYMHGTLDAYGTVYPDSSCSRHASVSLQPRISPELPWRGGTLIVSNVGGIGSGESAMPLLFPGGIVEIFALGRTRWE